MGKRVAYRPTPCIRGIYTKLHHSIIQSPLIPSRYSATFSEGGIDHINSVQTLGAAQHPPLFDRHRPGPAAAGMLEPVESRLALWANTPFSRAGAIDGCGIGVRPTSGRAHHQPQ